MLRIGLSPGRVPVKDRFPGWNPPGEKELQRYWRGGVVAIDANVLLNAYRYSHSTRDELLQALEGLGDRLWLPHRAAEEFHRNRLAVLIQQRLCAEHLEAELNAAREELLAKLDKRLRELGRRDREAFAKAVGKKFEELKKQIGKLDDEHHRGLGDRRDHRDDPLYERIVGLVSGKVGSPFDEERLAAIREDADRRLKEKIPPAIGDGEKEAEGRHGDVILWAQLVDRARETRKPMIFVTDDQKDWMWEIKGRIVGAKPALVAEMARETEQAFHVYSTAQFVRIASKTGKKVDEVVLQELEIPDADLPAEDGWVYDDETGIPIPVRPLPRGARMYGGGPAVPFKPSRFSSDGVYATSSPGSERVMLTLHDHALTLTGQQILCEVLDPHGSVSHDFQAASDSHGLRHIQCLYPHEFVGAVARLIPDEPYRVSWKAGVPLREVATDVFVIPMDAE